MFFGESSEANILLLSLVAGLTWLLGLKNKLLEHMNMIIQ